MKAKPVLVDPLSQKANFMTEKSPVRKSSGVDRLSKSQVHSKSAQNPTEKVKSKSQSVQERVMKKLMEEEHNQFCFDCGWGNPEYVSINNGIFLCFNCATSIHLEHYPVEVSYIKHIRNDVLHSPDSTLSQSLPSSHRTSQLVLGCSGSLML